MSEQFASTEPPPQARLAQMATGFILSRLVYTAASLGINRSTLFNKMRKFGLL